MQPSTTNLNSEEFAALLEKLHACQKARDWAEGKDLATAWTTCHRSDWLLWLLDKAAPLDPITNEFLTCRFAREVQHLNPDPRVLACIETREAWARGETTDAARAHARGAAWDVAYAAPRIVWDAAESAAGAVASAAAMVAACDAAMDVAVSAAGAAAEAAAWIAVKAIARGASWAAFKTTLKAIAKAAAWNTAKHAAWAGSWFAADTSARYSAWAAAWDATLASAQAKQADIIRELVPMPVLA